MTLEYFWNIEEPSPTGDCTTSSTGDTGKAHCIKGESGWDLMRRDGVDGEEADFLPPRSLRWFLVNDQILVPESDTRF